MPQKLLFALLVASRKLRQYFQGHPIKVLSTYPLERVLRSPNAAGRVAEWNIELQAFQLDFSTTRVIKGAALADFVAEWTVAPEPEVGESRTLSLGSEAPDGWVMYFDGAFVSNNIAAYEGLIAGLKATAALGVKRLTIKGDSQLLVNFSNKVYEPRDGHMEVYFAEVRKMEKQFLGLELQHVPRDTNKEADEIAKRASRRQPQEPGVFKE
ncbi:uncharacterized protein [Aegilops tauschii subsp. strangulata]|uniref:uncharacterized protein n=1 Tax=Aegilops tauschii subsp. strangulata TaxID=200361 RepID=UPI003CC85270